MESNLEATHSAPDAAPILLAEDDGDDVFFLRRALATAGLSHSLFAVNNGEEAVNYLGGHGTYADRQRFPLPRLLILDLKMPGSGGLDVLHWLQTRPELKHLPAVVLSSSAREFDSKEATKLGAVDYYVKPVDFANLVTIIRQIDQRWLSQRP